MIGSILVYVWIVNPTGRGWYVAVQIVKGDKVEVIDGPDLGKQGAVLAVLRKRNMVMVEGVRTVRLQCMHPCIHEINTHMRTYINTSMHPCIHAPMHQHAYEHVHSHGCTC